MPFHALAGVLSIAVLGAVMLASFNQHLSSRLIAMNLDSGLRQELEVQREKLAAIEIPAELGSGLRRNPAIHRSVFCRRISCCRVCCGGPGTGKLCGREVAHR